MMNVFLGVESFNSCSSAGVCEVVVCISRYTEQLLALSHSTNSLQLAVLGISSSQRNLCEVPLELYEDLIAFAVLTCLLRIIHIHNITILLLYTGLGMIIQ